MARTTTVIDASTGTNFNFTSIEDGIKESVEWFKKNVNVCRK